MVEAAASHHPHATVFVLITGGNVSTVDVLENNVTRSLVFLPNVRLRHLGITSTFEHTKLWTWYLTSDWQKPDHYSEKSLWLALGLLLLYK